MSLAMVPATGDHVSVADKAVVLGRLEASRARECLGHDESRRPISVSCRRRDGAGAESHQVE